MVAGVASAQDTPTPQPETSAEAAPDRADADGKQVAALKAQLEAERQLREKQQGIFERRLSSLEESSAAAEEARAAAEEAALLESLSADEEGAALESPERLQIYGFMDLALKRMWIPESSYFREVVATRETTFALGNVNLYFDARPSDAWRALAEVRFTNIPHGNETGLGGLGGGYTRTNNTVWDQADTTSLANVRWGGIVLERAWLQWTHSDLLQVRGGQWFTPWGIWNIDHGWPTVITNSLPSMILQQALPRQQVGLQVLGRYNRPPYAIGYHLTVSNGRGDVALVDYTDNKAVGFRSFLQYSGESEMRLGVTGYWGRNEDITKDLTAIEPLKIEITQTVASEEMAVGLDFSLDHGGTRLRTEGMISSRRFDRGKRSPAALEPPGRLDSDRVRYNWYVILAHRIAWVEPNMQLDLEHIPTGRGDAVVSIAPGINTYFSPESHIKWQYGNVRFLDIKADDGDHSVHNFHVATARWVLAF